MEAEKNNEGVINLAFVLAGALAAYMTFVVLDILGGTFGSIARFRNLPGVPHVLPVAIGLVIFIYLRFLNKNSYTWADEAVTEVRKVVWPSQKDVTAMTIVVVVMCLVAGLGFGIFDFFASQLIKVFVN